MIGIFYKDLIQRGLGKLSLLVYPIYRIRYLGESGFSLNVGCGDDKVPGYINIDVNVLRFPDVWMDIRHRFPFSEGSVKGIKMKLVAEHFVLKDLKSILSEEFRVLEEGGKIEIIVPDLEYAISNYVKPKLKKSEYDKIVPKGYEDFKSKGAIFNTMTLYDSQHKIMFDYSFMKEFLESVGFKKIRRKKSIKRHLVVEAWK